MLFEHFLTSAWVLDWHRVSGGALVRVAALEGVCRSSFWYVPRRG